MQNYVLKSKILMPKPPPAKAKALKDNLTMNIKY